MVDEERQLFERTEEYHVQRAYPLQDIMELLQQCGFQADVYEACTKEAPSAETERVYFVSSIKGRHKAGQNSAFCTA